MTPTQEKIYDLVKQEGAILQTELQDILGVSREYMRQLKVFFLKKKLIKVKKEKRVESGRPSSLWIALPTSPKPTSATTKKSSADGRLDRIFPA